MADFFCYIKVDPFVFDFYFSKYNSSTILINKKDPLYHLVINKLEHNPSIPPKLEDKYVLGIKLPYLDNTNAHFQGKKNIQYTNYITAKSQQFISAQLKNLIKEVFHTYVYSYCIACKMKRGCQKKAIESFISVNKIQMNNINYEMLKKSWDRSSHKKKLTNKIY